MSDSVVEGQEHYVPRLDYAATAWVVKHNLWKKRREDVVARLVNHREQGAQVIGTPTEIVNGRLRTAGVLAANEKKIEQVLSRLGVQRVDVAYGDTWMDIPLLEHADHPVAVYPDVKLKAIAAARGWEILGELPRYPQA